METDQRTCNHPKCTWTGFDGAKNQPDGRHPITPQCPQNLVGKQISMPPPHTQDMFVSVVDGSITTGTRFYGFNWREEAGYRNRGPFVPLDMLDIDQMKADAAEDATSAALKKAAADLKTAMKPLLKLAGNQQ